MIIMLQQFINRKYELNFLNNKYTENKPQLIIIYGRRRAGKTELIKEFINKKKAVYHLCTEDSLLENVNYLKLEFYNITGKSYFLNLDVDLFTLFKYFIDEIKNEKIIIVFDEIPYLISISRGVLSVFQKIYDELITNSNLFIIFSGSSISMMENEILNFKSPLYGRRTGSIEITGFDINLISYFYNNNFEDIVKINSIFGNIPFYLSLIDKNKSIEWNIKNKIFTKGEILYEEPRILLKEEFREPRVYELILKKISEGHNTYGDLQNSLHIDSGNISKYLETLISSRFIRYIIPLNQKRRGIYEVNDYFLNFYYKFVYPNISDLEIGNIDAVYNRIDGNLNTFYGHTFERLVLNMISKHIIPVPIKNFHINKFWHKDVEIDGVAINDENDVVFIEIKFSSDVDGIKIFRDLKYKSMNVKIKRNGEFFMVIAKSFKTKSDECINIDFDDIEKIIKRLNKS